MTSSERVYVIGGTGNVGTVAVKELLKNGVSVTIYARSPAKVQALFANNTKLAIVEGDLNDLTSFEKSIDNHSRLFLLVHDMKNLVKFKSTIAQKAYAAGVKQIVHISSITVGFPWRTSYIGESHRASEQAILSISERGAYVTLRPADYMSNHVTFDLNEIRNDDTIVDTYDLEEVQHWISTADIGLAAANILQDPIEKHADAVYQMVGDVVSLKDRAALLTKALGRTITYTKISPEEKYSKMIQKPNIPHAMALDFVEGYPYKYKVSPSLGILLRRAPETLEQWLEQNKYALL